MIEEVPGVTDDQIIIGTHTPLTGRIAFYAALSTAEKAYFDYINETEGGVHGRKIKYLIGDDQGSPDKTEEVVRKLVEQDRIFAMFGGLGTPMHLRVADYLQENGVPDLFPATGATEWTKNPSARPMLFNSTAGYVGTGAALGKYIADTYPGKKLGLLFRNDDFGRDGIDGVKRGVGDALEVVGEETYERADPDLNAQVDRLQEAESEVIVVWATGRHLSTALMHARMDLNWDVPIVITAVGATDSTIDSTGAEVIEGTVSIGFFRQAHETDDPGVAKHMEILREYAGTEASRLSISGQRRAELLVEVLKRAGRDLTREGLVKATESLTDFQCSVCLFPGSFSPTDHDFTQTGVLVRAEDGKWVRFGDGISWEGTLPGTLTVGDLKTVPPPG